MAYAATAGGLAPPTMAAPGVVALQRALLWLVGASVAIVFIEPSPYELVTLVAAVLAEILASLLTPAFAQPVDITSDARLVLPLIAVAVGILASVTALRRVTGADPAAAFG